MTCDVRQSNDIEATFNHEYTTKFIVDNSNDFKRINGLELDKYERLFFIFDKNISGEYREKIIWKLNLKIQFYFHEVEPVEYSKSIGYYPKLIFWLSEHNAGRYDAVIAVGGGIIIDLVSFTVSTYMRGLPFFIIATTLIGQTDASTAGKTCLNSENAKNLLGTFYYPKVVYNNINILSTCSKRITRQGLSEAFKYSLLTDGKILPIIIEFCNKDFDSILMMEIVKKTIESRIQIRQVDPLASNLGHTFGHALEKYFDYKILHGDAILVGTIIAMRYAVKKNLMKKAECDKIFNMMKESHLNIWLEKDLDVHRLIDFMRKDKKSSSKKLHLVMIRGIADPYIGDTPFYEADYSDVENFLEEFISEYEYTVENLALFLEGENLK